MVVLVCAILGSFVNLLNHWVVHDADTYIIFLFICSVRACSVSD